MRTATPGMRRPADPTVTPRACRLGHAVPLADVRVREEARDLVRELGGERGGAAGEELDAAEVVVLHGWVLEERGLG